MSVDTVLRPSWKVPIILGIFSLASLLLFILSGRQGVSVFRLSTSGEVVQLPSIEFPVMASGIVISVILIALTAFSAYRVVQAKRTPLYVIVIFGVLFMVGLLVWAFVDATLPVTGLLTGTVALSAPIIYGALGGVISERVGVVNIAIEGQLLAGAFTSAVVASVTRNPFLGLGAAMVAGMLVSFVLAAFSIKYLVDQVIVGVVLNVLVLGLTSFFFSQVLSNDKQLLNSPPRFDKWPIPVLSDIPIIGPVLFNQTVIIYIMYVAVGLVYYGLFHTKWGLRVRAVGEHPTAADTVGIKVNLTRFWNVSLAGAVAGLGGAFFTLGSVGSFQKEMTAGLGFIALAAVIFGRWDPIRATLAALLFGFATNLQNVLGIIGSPIPSEFMLMLPYIVTIIAVAGLVGQVRGPAAAGKPYVKA